jgi:hypothetical protein
MRRLVTWLLDGLPCDPRSRRALDETLLDWATEEADAGASLARWSADVSGCLAIVRTLVWSTTRDVGSVPVLWLIKRAVLFCLLPAALISSPLIFPLLGTVSYPRIALLLALVTPESLTVTVPLGLLLGLMWRSRHVHVPPAATAAGVAAVMLAFLAWVLPFINELFSSMYTGALADALPALKPRLEVEARAEVQSIDVSWIRASGFAALAGAAVLLAESLFPRIALRRHKWIAAVPTAYLLAGAIVSAIAHIFMAGNLATAVALWAQAALMVLVACAIQRRTLRETRAA